MNRELKFPVKPFIFRAISGLLGKVVVMISGVETTVLGLSTWGYSGQSREIIEAPATFAADFKERFAGVIAGGDVEVTGNFLGVDTGQTFLRSAFNAATSLTDIRFYMNDSYYYRPSPTTSPVSSVMVSKMDDVGQDASGVGSMAFTCAVNGILILVPTGV